MLLYFFVDGHYAGWHIKVPSTYFTEQRTYTKRRQTDYKPIITFLHLLDRLLLEKVMTGPMENRAWRKGAKTRVGGLQDIFVYRHDDNR